MLHIVYNIMSSVEVLIFLILIAKYIYRIRDFKTFKERALFWCTFLVVDNIVIGLNQSSEFWVLVPFLFLIAFIVLNREKNKLKGIFLVIPIMGMMFPYATIPISIIYIFHGSMEKIISEDITWLIILDIVFWICFLIFIWKGKEWRRRFNEVIKNGYLEKWESNILNATGLFLLVFSTLILSIDTLVMNTTYAKLFLAVGIVIVVLLESAIIAMVTQGNSKCYFKNMAVLNEHYLKAQYEHFKRYQETQKETRRIRHDMNNHISCLYGLIQKQEYEEALTYMKGLQQQVENIEQQLYSGNEIADIIINEKNGMAKKNNIRILIEGRLGNLSINAIDICTIFSNALDNAIESLIKSDLENKEIHIDVKNQNLMQFIRFYNPVENKSKYRFLGSTKKDYRSHGFGLGNIRMVVEKYNGQMDYRIETISD
ncbi:MAG: sensor histidine kinase [Cellulosilyticaceae bacterium]